MKNKFLTFSLIALSTMMLTTTSCKTAKPGFDNTEGNTEIDKKDPTLSLNYTSTTVNMGQTIKLRAVVENLENYELIWTSSDSNVATVDKHGVVTGKDVLKDTDVTISVALKGYANLKASVKITVKYLVREGDVFITNVKENSNFASQKINSNLPTSDADRFQVSRKEHLVGDDNPIDISPVSIFKQMVGGKLTEISYDGEWEYNLTISEKIAENNYVNLPTDSNLIEAIDNKKCTIDFSDKAIGKTFKVKIEPKNLTENQLKNPDYDETYVAISEFKVIDGYNVYTAKDLSLIENRDLRLPAYTGILSDPAINAWNAFKKANQIDVNLHPSTMILQAPIKITTDDFPSYFIFTDKDVNMPTPTETYLGTLKDDVQIYAHHTPNTGSFNFFGNYFSIDAQAVPLIRADHNEVTAEDQIIIPESELFRFQPTNKPDPNAMNAENKAKILEEYKNTTTNIQDVKFLGNSSKENAVKWSGGILLINSDKSTLSIDNVVTRKWYQSFSINSSPLSTLTINNTTAKDNYSSFAYTEGCKEVVAKNSIFDSCGGPAFIICDVVPKDGGEHQPCDLKLIDSEVTSFVNGSEGWFKGMGVSEAVSNLAALDAGAYSNFGRTFLKQLDPESEFKYFNFISIHMSSELNLHDILSGKASPIQGSVSGSKTINGELKEEFMFDIDKSAEANFQSCFTKYAKDAGNTLMRTNAASEGNDPKTTTVYTNGKELYQYNGEDVTKNLGLCSGMTTGEKLAIYFMGFMLVVDSYSLLPPAPASL